MRNLIIAVSVFFAVGATAQVKKATPAPALAKTAVTKTAITKTEVVKADVVTLSPQEAGKKDAENLAAFIPVTPDLQLKLTNLFKTKHKMLDNGNLTEERKKIVAKSIESKLESALNPADFEKLKTNTALFQSLIN